MNWQSLENNSRMGITMTSEEISKAMLDGLTSRIRDELRKKILESIEPDLNAALDAAVASLKIAIQQHHDYAYNNQIINIVVDGIKR